MRKPSAPCRRLLIAAAASLTVAAAAPGTSRAEATVFVEAGPEWLDGAGFGSIEPGFAFSSDALEVQLGLPMRLRLNGPLAARDGLVRGEDWDSFSDAGRVLRRFELALAERTVTLRMGPLAHQFVGHGTLVNGLASSLDPDSVPVGARGRVVLGAVAAEALASDLASPGVVGGALVLEPLSLWGEVNDRVHFGASLFADPSAPRAAGAPPAVLYGVGLDLGLVRNRWVRLSPYFDANGRGEGFGLHAGLLADLSLGPVDLSLKGEWRRARAPYSPEYFDVAYSLERSDLSARAEAPLAKADAGRGTSNSGRGELRLVAGPLSAAASFSGRGAGLWDVSLVIEASAGELEVAAFLAARAFSLQRDPERVLASAQARYRLSPYLYAWADASRLFRALERRPILQAAAGMGFAFQPSAR
jgi:hypothetical protein